MNTTDTIREFITHDILHETLANPLGNDEDLVDSGIIDSLGVMALLAFLEEKFLIKIPDSELMPENFATLSAITALVESQKNR